MNANNVSPIYAADGRILFTSDRSRDGQAHLYPQLDEYEEAPTVSGIWSLDPATGDLKLLDHAPSGDFKPTIDSFGRVIFSRWDHLQRDQQADGDNDDVENGDPPTYGTFNWSSESANAVALATRAEQYPEPRPGTPGLEPYEEGHTFNHFFPWMMRQDGTELETLNHIGRHELHTYFNRNRNDDANVDEFICGDNACGRFNEHDVFNMLQIRESPMPASAGLYYAIDAPEFYTNAAGMLFSMSAGPSVRPDLIGVTWLSHPDTGGFDDSPGPCHTGFYRNPLPLSDGTLIAVHAGERSAGVPETRLVANEGTRAAPNARYKFRMRNVVNDTTTGCTSYRQYGTTLTAGAGITKTLWFWDPDVRVDYTAVTMWELDPVEVRSRPAPDPPEPPLGAPEQQIFDQEQVNVAAFRQYLEDRDLALIVSRDVTTRDAADRQQPFNLKVPGGTAQTVGAGGTIYDVEYMQLFQGDLIRGLDGPATPSPGRRVLAQRMHDSRALNPALDPGDPPSSVEIGDDGSMAAFVPAHRALSWQLTDGAGTSIVRERYWLTFQPGEIRTCASCHGLNDVDQAGQNVPQNPPEALRALLVWWKSLIFASPFESGDTGDWSIAAP